MSANSARSIRPVCELLDDYEVVVLADGTKIKRERQTKAQARIQALKIKKRNEQLRQTLNSLSLAAGASLKVTDNAIKDKDLIDQQINQIKNALQQNQKKSVVKHVEQDTQKDDCSLEIHADGISAIEKQLIANSEVKAKSPDLTKQAETESKPNKPSEFKLSKLKKLFFG